jgi:hypothetical protein
LVTAGKPQTARQVAMRALELDDLNPHADKKVSEQMREQLQELVKDDATVPPAQPPKDSTPATTPSKP